MLILLEAQHKIVWSSIIDNLVKASIFVISKSLQVSPPFIGKSFVFRQKFDE